MEEEPNNTELDKENNNKYSTTEKTTSASAFNIPSDNQNEFEVQNMNAEITQSNNANIYGTDRTNFYGNNNQNYDYYHSMPDFCADDDKPSPKKDDIRSELVDYVVTENDTINKIAIIHEMNVAYLKHLNGINDDYLYPGQRLKVKVGKTPQKDITNPVDVYQSTLSDQPLLATKSYFPDSAVDNNERNERRNKSECHCNCGCIVETLCQILCLVCLSIICGGGN